MQVKTIIDYYDLMLEMFPDVPKKDIKKILNYGWKILYMYNSSGADTIIRDNLFWCYIGHLKKDSLEYFNYYIKKLRIKLRILYKRKRVKWDGYYYFALTESAYLNYLKLKNARGRKRKKFDYGPIIMYKMLDECKIAQHFCSYIFKIPYIVDLGFSHYVSKLITNKAELILEREPLKFKDVLTCTNEYDIL